MAIYEGPGFTPSTDVPNLQLHLQQLPLKIKSKNSLSNFYATGKGEKAHLQGDKRVGDTISP